MLKFLISDLSKLFPVVLDDVIKDSIHDLVYGHGSSIYVYRVVCFLKGTVLPGRINGISVLQVGCHIFRGDVRQRDLLAGG